MRTSRTISEPERVRSPAARVLVPTFRLVSRGVGQLWPVGRGILRRVADTRLYRRVQWLPASGSPEPGRYTAETQGPSRLRALSTRRALQCDRLFWRELSREGWTPALLELARCCSPLQAPSRLYSASGGFWVCVVDRRVTSGCTFSLGVSWPA